MNTQQPKDYPCGRDCQVRSFVKLIVFGILVWLAAWSVSGLWEILAAEVTK